MVNFAEKRLQVFVSSTFTDLQVERQAAVEAILRAGHIPAGMELFTAGDESQMEVIRQWIDASDVYLLILANRYGSLEPTSGKSYTQIEYEYAVNKGKPVFACVAALDSLEDPRRISLAEQEQQEKLADFRQVVLTRMVRFWRDPRDIMIAIAETLATFSRRTDLEGWVRPDSMNELATDIPKSDVNWLFPAETLLTLESEIAGGEIWIASLHLANDTGTMYSTTPSPLRSTIATVQNNLRRKVDYVFLVPDSDEISVRLPQLHKNYADYPGNMRVITRPIELIARLTLTETVIYNPRFENRCPPRVFIELPVRVAHQYWAELADDMTYRIVARAQEIVDN